MNRICHLIFLLFCTVITFFFCGIIINTIQLVLYCTVKQYNSEYYYRINKYLCYTYFALLTFYSDWYCTNEVHLYINENDFKKYFGKEHMYVICNHPSEVDFLFLTSIAEKTGLLGTAKSYVKSIKGTTYIPTLGLTFYISDFIFLERNYETDKIIIENKINELMTYPHHILLYLAPEGTRFTKEKHKCSVQHAKEKGLPILKHHLIPRTKGFTMSLPIIRQKINAVYDLTITYDKTKFMGVFNGEKIKTYCHFRRIPIKNIPTEEQEASKFLIDLFEEKDKLLDTFYKTGDFRTNTKDTQVLKMKMKRSYLILVNAVAWYTFSLGLVLYISMYLFLNGYIVLLNCCGAAYLFMLLVSIYFASSALIRTASSYGLKKKNDGE